MDMYRGRYVLIAAIVVQRKPDVIIRVTQDYVKYLMFTYGINTCKHYLFVIYNFISYAR